MKTFIITFTFLISITISTFRRNPSKHAWKYFVSLMTRINNYMILGNVYTEKSLINKLQAEIQAEIDMEILGSMKAAAKRQSLLDKWKPVLESDIGKPIGSVDEARKVATIIKSAIKLNKPYNYEPYNYEPYKGKCKLHSR